MDRFRLVINSVVTLLLVGLSAFLIGSLSKYIDSGQASLLFLLVVLGIGIGFGAGPACLAALVCFGFWDSIFVHSDYLGGPIGHGGLDWLTLLVYLVTGLVAARLSSLARDRTQQALSRQSEISLLFEASETINKEVDANGAVSTLSHLLRVLCRAPKCTVWKVCSDSSTDLELIGDDAESTDVDVSALQNLVKAAAEHRTVIGFDETSSALWQKGAEGERLLGSVVIDGAFVPLITESKLIGVLYVAARQDKRPFSDLDQRLIMTLANNVAFVLEREALYEEAAIATALHETDILKDSLLSMVSHELRSPLAAIKATASAAESEKDPTESLKAITDEADRLTEIVSNLLDLSRLEAGAWQPQKDWCDVSEIISTALDELPDSDSARVDVTTVGGIPLVHVDYIQIALVIKNIIQNATKYTPNDSRITVTVAPEHNGFDERPSGVSVRIRDFGPGIAPNDLDRVFERFFRSRDTKHNGIPGTGLGLALVKAIVTAHGGKVWASNPLPGKPSGAVFTLVLPVE